MPFLIPTSSSLKCCFAKTKAKKRPRHRGIRSNDHNIQQELYSTVRKACTCRHLFRFFRVSCSVRFGPVRKPSAHRQHHRSARGRHPTPSPSATSCCRLRAQPTFFLWRKKGRRTIHTRTGVVWRLGRALQENMVAKKKIHCRPISGGINYRLSFIRARYWQVPQPATPRPRHSGMYTQDTE